MTDKPALIADLVTHTCNQCDFITTRRPAKDELRYKCILSGNHINPAMTACTLFSLPTNRTTWTYTKEKP